MDIDVQKFIKSLREPGIALPKEITGELPTLEKHMEMALAEFRRTPGAADIMVGQQILSHRYGELMAIRLRRWIEENYTIGSAETYVTAATDPTEESMEDAA